MIISILELVFSLFVILVAAEFFTNGIESLGKRFSFSQAVVGSVLSAVGTALPETILPIVAIFSPNGHSGKEIGLGAILGAPFMLATLAFFFVGISALVRHLRKKHPHEIKVEPHSIKRDLTFFIVMYSMAVFVPIFAGKESFVPLAIFLVAAYIFYVRLTIKGDSAAVEHFEALHFFTIQTKLKLTRLDAPHAFMIIFQIVFSVFTMVFASRLFVHNLQYVSHALGMSPMLFALILAPIATELPEKFNSINWTLKGKDTLAVGNITGAMVFQSTFPVAVGLLFTDWRITSFALASVCFALISAIIVLISLTIKKHISPYVMLFGGILYFAYLLILFH